MTKIVLKFKISPEEAHQGAGASVSEVITGVIQPECWSWKPPAGDQGIRNHFQLSSGQGLVGNRRFPHGG